MDNEPPGWVAIPVLIVVVPIRLLWEVCSAAVRAVGAYVVRPIGWLLCQALLLPLAWLLREAVLRPLWWVLCSVASLLRWVGRSLLMPLGLLVFRYLLRPAWTAFAWLLTAVRAPLAYAARLVGLALYYLLVWPVRALARFAFRYLLRPAWIAFVWTLMAIRAPIAYAARWIGRGLVALWPLLVAAGRLLAYVWRLAGVVLFYLLVWPVRQVWRVLVLPVLRAARHAWRATVTPAARWVRVRVWEPARVAARSVSRALGLDARRP